MFQNMPIWPARASTMASNVDALFIFLLVVSGLMTVSIFTMVIFFAVRYRRRAVIKRRGRVVLVAPDQLIRMTA